MIEIYLPYMHNIPNFVSLENKYKFFSLLFLSYKIKVQKYISGKLLEESSNTFEHLFFFLVTIDIIKELKDVNAKN